MIHIHKYPKIYALWKPECDGIWRGHVIIEEKIDGSQFSFGKLNGSMWFKSKNTALPSDTSGGLFGPSIQYLNGCVDRIREGYIYRGEAVSAPRHNILTYAQTPPGNTIIFDIECPDGSIVVQPSEKDRLAGELGLWAVPVLYDGDGSTVKKEDLDEYMSRLSCLGHSKMEGVVIKNYGHKDSHGNTCFAKVVSQDFKETRPLKIVGSAEDGIIAEICGKINKEAVWNKAVRHLADDGKLENDVRDIGPLLGEMSKDFQEENKQEIEKALFKWGWKRISKQLISGFPDWYKLKLMEKVSVGSETAAYTS